MMYYLEDMATITSKGNQEKIYFEAVRVMTTSEADKATTPFAAGKELTISSEIKVMTD